MTGTCIVDDEMKIQLRDSFSDMLLESTSEVSLLMFEIYSNCQSDAPSLNRRLDSSDSISIIAGFRFVNTDASEISFFQEEIATIVTDNVDVIESVISEFTGVSFENVVFGEFVALESPSASPSISSIPTVHPTVTAVPTRSSTPTSSLSQKPSQLPTFIPSHQPTVFPSSIPTSLPSMYRSQFDGDACRFSIECMKGSCKNGVCTSEVNFFFKPFILLQLCH